MLFNTQWIATADDSVGALYECERSVLGSLRINERSRVVNRWGRVTNPRLRDAFVRIGAEDVLDGALSDSMEARMRFADEIRDWLELGMECHGVANIKVFAPANFLGFLRRCVDCDSGITLLRGEFSGLRPHQLAVHPSVVLATGPVRLEQSVTSSS